MTIRQSLIRERFDAIPVCCTAAIGFLTIFSSSNANAYAYSTYYGIYQHYYLSSGFQPINTGAYERQNYRFVSGIIEALAASGYGYPAENGEEWRFDLLTQGQLLSRLSFVYQDYCIYSSVDNGPYYLIGCGGDPFSYWLIGTFDTQCLDTEDYEVVAYHVNDAAPPSPFRPTDFEPSAPKLTGISDITPSLPSRSSTLAGSKLTLAEESGGAFSVHVKVTDNLDCGKPKEWVRIEPSIERPPCLSLLMFSGSSEWGCAQAAPGRSHCIPWRARNGPRPRLSERGGADTRGKGDVVACWAAL